MHHAVVIDAQGCCGDGFGVPQGRLGRGRDTSCLWRAELAQEVDRNLGHFGMAVPRDSSDAVVSRRCGGVQIGRQRRRVELALQGDGVDRGLIVGVIAQPQPGVPTLHAIIPCDMQARVGRSDLIDGRHPTILPANMQG